PAGTGVPTGAGTAVTSLPVTINNLLPDTAYEVYVRAECSAGFYSDWSIPYTFTTEIQTEFTVDCAVGPTNVTYCYGNNDTTMFTFTATDPTLYLTIFFNSGTVENNNDEIIIYDSDGTTVLYSGYGNSGDLAGLEIQSTGGVIYVQVTSNGSNSCASGNQTTLDFDAICNTCLNQQVTFTSIDDCGTVQYYVDVDVTDMGDATSLTLTDNQGSAPQVVTTIGTYTFGPYPLGTDTYVTVANTNDTNCVIVSDNMNVSNCPPMSVSTTTYTVDELVTDVLINSDCAQVFNIQYSTGTNYGSVNGIGYFYNAFNFPFTDGVVLTSGTATEVVGPNDTTLGNGGTGWLGDTDLENISGAGTGYNASYIEFDFIPLTDHISFDFLFASEEYTSAFECTFSDVFAFILTDLSGVETNLAVIPGTNIPVTVVNVHGGIGTCGPANATYFDQYNANGTGEIDFNGQTVVMTAASNVVAGQTYHIKLGIQDDGDSIYDSAVFLGSGSFDIGDLDLGDDILLTSGNAQCEGDIVTLDAGTVPSNATIAWYMDGNEIIGATSATLDVSETATYTAVITYTSSSCALEGEVLVEFFPLPEPSFTDAVITKSACQEETVTVNVDNAADLAGNLTYTWLDPTSNVIQTGTSPSYTFSGDTVNPEQGVYTVTVSDDANSCSGSAQVEIILEGYVSAGQPSDMWVCDDISNDGYAEFDLTSRDSAVTNNLSNVIVSYYASQDDADDAVNPLSSPYTNEDPNFQTIYVRLESTESDCYDIVTFDLLVYDTPVLDGYDTYYEVCSNGITPTVLTMTPSNFALTDTGVTFTWYQNGTTLANSDNVLDVYDAGEYA
ncbi:choice-of-anchor L domain-containing protein, partial [Neptunitalea chrysea]|uniref:choice-of-anchor L domain-containing protein n=1 Tax=Neptunitalea chrysea TaxID=1647581 RepID=UPI002491275E